MSKFSECFISLQRRLRMGYNAHKVANCQRKYKVGPKTFTDGWNIMQTNNKLELYAAVR